MGLRRLSITSLIFAGLLLIAPSIAFAQDNPVIGRITTNGAATCVTTGSCVRFSSLPVNNASIGVQITGSFTGTLSFESTVDGSNYVTAIGCIAASGQASFATAAGQFQCPSGGITGFQVRGSAAITGTAVVTIQSSLGAMGGGGGTVTVSGTVDVDVVANDVAIATEDKQDDEIALLTTIDADTGTISTNTTTLAGAVTGGTVKIAASDGTPIVAGATSPVSIASAAVASGAYASGSIASGAIASGAVASGAVASGAYAAGSLSQAIPDPCTTGTKLYYVVNLASATVVEIATGVASEYWHICGVNMIAQGANKVLLATDNSAGCGSLTAGLNGGTTDTTGWSFAADGSGIALGNGMGTVMKAASTNHSLCLDASTTAQLSGTIIYVSSLQ